MRTITVTEKYKAVNEGRMAKSEFVRQMRQEYPMYISNFDGFDSAVQILKNKQMLFEAKKSEAKAPVYDEKPALTYSLDALDRGIRIELNTMGIDMAAQTVKAEDYKQAESKAKDNLEKNATHYLDLMSGESNKVDKHDREVEVKRGAGTVDAFNSMKKATLKEEVVKEDEEEDAKNDADSYDHDYPHQDEDTVNPNPPMSEDAKKALLGKVVGALRANYPDITVGIIKDFIRTHADDLLGGEDIESEFVEYISNNYEGPSDMGEKKGTDHDGDGDIDGDDYMAAKDAAIKKAMGKDEGYAMKRMQQAHDQDRRAGKKSTYDIAKEKQKDQKDKLKEAIKSIIEKTLKVDSMNEAATNRLASLQEDYGDYSGASQIINQLENIVTEVEQFHTKTRDKIQKVYDSMEGIENAEGLKIGVFIGPSIENAFRQDLRPVTKHGYTKDLALPKAKRLDPNLVAQARAQGDIEEIGDAKHTVFTPNI